MEKNNDVIGAEAIDEIEKSLYLGINLFESEVAAETQSFNAAIKTTCNKFYQKLFEAAGGSSESFASLSPIQILSLVGERQVNPEKVVEIIDSCFGKQGKLIQPSHFILPYSLIRNHLLDKAKRHNALMIYHERFAPEGGFKRVQFDPQIENISASEVRSNELLREFSAENSERAFKGDLLYWHAWLAATGFTFTSPIELQHIKEFAIQHAEGLPLEIDKKLLTEGYKQSPGPHQISTIKRRLASLSIALQLDKQTNPTTNPEFRKLMEKLTKKYGSTKRKGRAITRDILFAILDTCRDQLKDCRDRALILFGWASGGRRRSEISNAEVKNLEPIGDQGFFIKNFLTFK